MFTGLISHQGRFLGFRRGRSALAVEAPGLAAKLAPGASIAINGVCLTLTGTDRDALTFDLSRETLAKTTLGALKPGAVLNLELPLTLADPLGGHLVSGHIDAVGKVVRISARPPGKRVGIAFPAALRLEMPAVAHPASQPKTNSAAGTLASHECIFVSLQTALSCTISYYISRRHTPAREV
jgi:riboflavin synthase